ncbi:MAG: hypothetical protein HYV09_32990 [Deltaproteobacteria bacterium]|nr:hypothetical protein [Deltaproteobacteria bacterium]
MRLLLVLVLSSAPGCSSLQGRDCSTEYRLYDVTLTRTLDVPATNVDRTTMQACLDDACTAVPTPDSSGHATFGTFGATSGELTLSTAEDGRLRVSATFRVGERAGAAGLRVIVRESSAARTHAAEGIVTFAGDGCHSAPASTTV